MNSSTPPAFSQAQSAPRRRIAQQSEAQHLEEFRSDVLRGLQAPSKFLLCKYLYDERGSKLFDQICECHDYYPMRTEAAIMQKYGSEIGSLVGEEALLVEYGSGSSLKTETLLDNIPSSTTYAPVDISEDHLLGTAERLHAKYPHLEIVPIIADFTKPFELPPTARPSSHVVGYFPGSTIGNFEPSAALELLHTIAETCGDGGGLVIGVDLQKEVPTLERAYNDSDGITAAFNLNLLHRINRELDGDFMIDQFRHVAEYNRDLGRIEIFLESICDQTVSIDNQQFKFASGERVHTEYSHKYTIEGFEELAAQAGWRLNRVWTDPKEYFAVMHLEHEESQANG